MVATGSRPYLPGRDDARRRRTNRSPRRGSLPLSMGGMIPGLASDERALCRRCAGERTRHRPPGAWCSTAMVTGNLAEPRNSSSSVAIASIWSLPLPFAGVDLEPSNAALFSQRVRARGMRITAKHRHHRRFRPEVALVDINSGDEQTMDGVDTVVLVIGRRSNDRLFCAFEGRCRSSA